jgi:hypothetical protein
MEAREDAIARVDLVKILWRAWAATPGPATGGRIIREGKRTKQTEARANSRKYARATRPNRGSPGGQISPAWLSWTPERAIEAMDTSGVGRRRRL